MPTKMIDAVNNPWGGPLGGAIGNSQGLIEVVNNSGGTLTQGDVVIWDTANPGGINVVTTTTANSPNIAGVISVTGDTQTTSQTVPAGGTCWLCVDGIARVNIGANVVAAGGLLSTFTTAKQAQTTGTALGNLLGVALEANGAKDANNTIRAIIKLG